MSVGELIAKLYALDVDRDAEIILRCEPEEDMGPCFRIGAISVEQSHLDESINVVIDGTQEVDDASQG